MATVEDKIKRVKDKLEGRTGLSNLIPGTKAYQFIEAISYEHMQLEYISEENDRKRSLAKSKERELDAIGTEFFGLHRLGEIPPYISSSMKCIKFYVSTGTFGDINNGEDIIVPEGVTIVGTFANSYFKFRVSEYTILDKNTQEKYVSADLVQGPLSAIPSNVLTTHDLTNYALSSNNLLKVTNSTPVNSGRSVESDENFRYRIVNSPKAAPQTTVPAFHSLATEIPGVSNVFIEQASNGGGTFTIYVQGITPITGDDVVQRVKDAAQIHLSPWVVNYTITKPNYIGISCDLNVVTKGALTDTISRNIKNAIASLINNIYGESFHVNTILATAVRSNPDIMDVSFNSVFVHSGKDELRTYYEVDFTQNSDPVIYTSNYEKFVTEPIANAIIVRSA